MAKEIGLASTGYTMFLGYPSTNREWNISYSDPNLDDSFGRRYGHDELGRVTERYTARIRNYRSFGYKAAGPLEEVKFWTQDPLAECEYDPDEGQVCDPLDPPQLDSTWTYLWDSTGNPDGEVVQAGNRLQTMEGRTLSYDADGNLIEMTGGGETVTFSWNSLGQLESATSSVHGTVQYQYDALGRRVSMTDAGGTTYFVLDGATVVADVSAAGTAERFYNYYPGSYRLHSMREGSDGYLYLADGNANVLGLIDSYTGAVHASYSYTPFGRSDQSWQPGENRFRFASGEVDRLGLYYFRARYYSPELRRFISEDPIGLAGGVNPYMYAGNDPINQSDPTGLLSQQCGEDGSFDCPYQLPTIFAVAKRRDTSPLDLSWSVLRPGSLDVDAILAATGGIRGMELRAPSAEPAEPRGNCAAAITVAVMATTEDIVTVMGVGAVVKGVKGTKALVRGARWAAANRLHVPHAGATGGLRQTSRFLGRHVAGMGWGMAEHASYGQQMGFLDWVGGFVPGLNMGLAIFKAADVCTH